MNLFNRKKQQNDDSKNKKKDDVKNKKTDNDDKKNEQNTKPKKKIFGSLRNKYRNMKTALTGVTDLSSGMVNFLQHYKVLICGIIGLIIFIVGLTTLIHTGATVLSAQAAMEYLSRETVTADEVMRYQLMRSRSHVLEMFSDGLGGTPYVYRGDEKEMYDNIMKLFDTNANKHAFVFYGAKSIGKTTTLAMVLFHMSRTFDIVETPWWLCVWFEDNEENFGTFCRLNNCELIKSLCRWISDHFITKYETTFYPFLEAPQVKEDLKSFKTRRTPNAEPPLSTEKEIYFLFFRVSLKSEGLSAQQQIETLFNERGSTGSVGNRFQMQHIKEAGNRLDRPLIIWISLTAGSRYGSSDNRYTGLLDMCRNYHSRNVKYIVEASKMYPAVNSEYGAGRLFKVAFAKIAPENVNEFAQAYDKDSRVLNSSEIRAAGGRPEYILRMVRTSLDDVLADARIEGRSWLEYFPDALQNSIQEIIFRACEYDDYHQAYFMHRNELEKHLNLKDIDFKDMEPYLSEVQFEHIPFAKRWYFVYNAVGYVFCELKTSLVSI